MQLGILHQDQLEAIILGTYAEGAALERCAAPGADALPEVLATLREVVAVRLQSRGAKQYHQAMERVCEHARLALAKFDGIPGSGAIGLGHLPLTIASGDGRLRHVLEAAHELLVRIANRSLVSRSLLNSPTVVREYLAVHFAGAERELFVAVFLDAQLCVLAAETLFAGTLTQTSVYPREIVRRALHHNAASVVLAHNHPSGVAEPSRADEHLTRSLAAALALVDVSVVDHFIVAGTGAISMAERGLV